MMLEIAGAKQVQGSRHAGGWKGAQGGLRAGGGCGGHKGQVIVDTFSV